jgi:hypothetical protein
VGKTWNFWCWCSTSYKNSWELRGNNLGISWEKVNYFIKPNVKVSNQNTNKTKPNVKF